MSGFLTAIRWPLLVVLGAVVVTHALAWLMPDGGRANLFNLAGYVVYAWAGWQVISSGQGGLLAAALAGVLLFFTWHLLFTGAWLMLQGQVDMGNRLMITIILFSFVPALTGLAGGLAARYLRGSR